MLAIIGLIFSLAIIFVLVLYKVNLGISLIAGSILLGVFSSSLPYLLSAIVQTMVAHQTIELVLNLLSIAALNYTFSISGSSQELVRSLRQMVSSSILLVITPIIFGIIPLSGGALFSAPLVDLEGQKLNLKNERKVFFNMWFRHIPHLIYPLETALVIAASLSQISLGELILYQFPIFVVGMLIGLPIGLRGIDEERRVNIRWRYVKDFFRSFWPILCVVILIAVFQVKVFLATTLGTIIIMITQRVSISTLASQMRDFASITCIALGIMLYRNIFENTGTIELISTVIQNQSIWTPIGLIVFSFLIGLIIGESTPSTTLAFSMLSAFTFNPATAGAVFTSVYFGHLISPLHLCFAVTSDYFKTRFSEMYQRLFPATIIALIAETIIMFLLTL